MSIRAIAVALNLSRAEVHGVVSFSHDFHTSPIRVPCSSSAAPEACQARGCEALVEALGGAPAREDRDGLLPRTLLRSGPMPWSARPFMRRLDAARHGRLGGEPGMTRPAPVVRISHDALALACGADAVARAFEALRLHGGACLEPGHALARTAWPRSTAWASARSTPDDAAGVLDGYERQGDRAGRGPSVHRPASNGCIFARAGG